MKKIGIIILCICMIFALIGCSAPISEKDYCEKAKTVTANMLVGSNRIEELATNLVDIWWSATWNSGKPVKEVADYQASPEYTATKKVVNDMKADIDKMLNEMKEPPESCAALYESLIKLRAAYENVVALLEPTGKYNDYVDRYNIDMEAFDNCFYETLDELEKIAGK